MSWVPLIAWLAALVVAAVVLGFCVYEISWKARRLSTDLGRLQAVGVHLQRLQGDLAAVQQRAATLQSPGAPSTGNR